jgi:hypothetical protein
MGALEEQYAAQNEICNGRGDSSHQGNVNRLKALMERDKALFESLSGQPNVGAAALASAKSGYETHMGLYDKARASQASCQQDLANGLGVQARDQQQRLASALADAQSKLRAYRERRAAFNQALAAYKAAQQTVAAPAK